MKRWPALAVAACIAALSWDATAAGPREVHGVADAFAEPGIALAWGVLRGDSEATTVALLRIVPDASGSYAFVSVAGLHPFSQQRRTLLERVPLGAGIDVRVPRTHFADFPRTEIRLYGDAAAAARDEPALVVLYFGLPDTTPESVTEPALAADVAARLARARKAGSPSP